ncbi:uncharacterized protein LOC115672919 isoform X2 [Syzygium oleosum]|uniref:uncharacterized protein LOC115672919 isoform X2 n=1 Tax=Syzygium oleosum TaxID=219896 RepID=UPI0011D1B77B|nr:uncharacterized protein LOC115672919 isoform X2 [Syzygium oleosum]
MHRRDVIRRAEIARVRSRAQPWRRQLSKTKTHRSPPLAHFRFGGKSCCSFPRRFARAELVYTFEMAPQTQRSAAQGNSQAVEPKKEWMHHKKQSVNKTVRHEQCGQQLAGGRTVLTANQRDLILEIQQKCAGIQAWFTQQLRNNNFMKLNPPTFLGVANHSEAVSWLIKMEELFNVFGRSYEEKVDYATYRLSETAITWWQLEKSKCKLGAEPCTWDNFEKAFCAQYIPDSVRLQMAEDLINLKQKNLTVV